MTVSNNGNDELLLLLSPSLCYVIVPLRCVALIIAALHFLLCGWLL